MARARTTPRVSLRFVEDLIARHLELEHQLEALHGLPHKQIVLGVDGANRTLSRRGLTSRGVVSFAKP